MSKELVIAANRHETKVAILEDDQLVEVYFQRANEYSLAGSIHKGRVTRVLPGMQSAFVDLGLERDTFLYVSDFFEENEEFDSVDDKPARPPRQEGPPSGENARGEGVREESRSESPRAEHSRNDRQRNDRQRNDRPPRNEGGRTESARTESSPDPGLTATVNAEPVSSTSTPPGSELEGAAPAQDRGGDQRGRRSRRRRNRGRGFPDSKYVSDVNTPADDSVGEEETEMPAAEPLAATPVGNDFAVLPGESLAKYRHSGPPTETSAEPQPVAHVETPVSSASFIEPRSAEPMLFEPEIEAPEIEPDNAADGVHDDTQVKTEADGSQEPVDVSHFEPDAPLHPEREEPEASFEPEPIAATPAEIGELIFEPVELTEIEVIAIVAESSKNPVTGAASLDEEEDREIQALILGHLESLEEPGEAQLDSEASAETAVEGDAPLTANLREPGGRFMHRMPRRMRRKMRGGDQPRTGEQPRVEQDRSTSTESRPSVENRPPGDARTPPENRPPGGGRNEGRSSEARNETGTGDPWPRSESHGRHSSREKAPLPSITELLKEGQEILVQIAKEPLGQKGARITSHIALPGRYVVYMPTLEHMGVSRKIASDEERLRLKRILQGHREGLTGGYIVRTAGEGKTDEEIGADMKFLFNLWQDIRQKAEKKPAPLLLHHDLDIVQRILRDQLTENFKAVWVDNEELYESVLRFMQRFQPALVSRVKLYTRPAPIFDAFNVTAELEKALRPKVWLKSGGYIVINQTEALVAIDVNTGKYVGKSNRLEDTIVKTNTEAVKEIVRQVRLRDLGGIIIVDFIDMEERKNRQKVMQVLEEAMRADRAPYKILQFNDFGLVAITRKRVKQSLERTLCSPCFYCEGAGYVKSVQTIVGELLQEAEKLAATVEGKDVVLRVHPEVAKVLKSHQNKYLEELEEILRRPVLVRGDPTLHHEKFDLG